MSREEVVREALEWVGTPYLHEGFVKGPQGGTDCAMILVGIYCGLDIVPFVDPRPYPMQWNLHQNEETYLDYFKRYAKQVDAPGLGDMMLFKYGRVVSHSGIYVGNNMMVHASRQDRQVMLTETQPFMHRYVSSWSVF